MRRDFAPSREAGPAVAALTANGVGTCGADDNQAQALHLIPMAQFPAEIASTLNAAFGDKLGLEDQHINGGAPLFVPMAFSSKDYGGDAMADCSPTLRAGGHSESHANAGIPPAVAYAESLWQRIIWRVRRVMPVECERLQGFPDNYTRIPWRQKSADNCPDGPRYKVLGNSWAVPNVRWIGRRIAFAIAMASTANENGRDAERNAA